MDLTDNVKVMLGGRLDSFDITVDDIKNGTSESRTDDRFSPRAGLIYKPQENVSFFVAYSESFYPKAGEQYKKQSAGAAITDPDTFENTEIGFKMDINPDLMFTCLLYTSDAADE